MLRNQGFISENMDDETILLDGFEHCIDTIVESIYGRHVVYNQKKVLQTLMDRDDMTYEEAVEYYGYNILGSYNGELMPMFNLKASDLL